MKETIKVLETDERGGIYDCGPVQVVFWNAGSKSSVHMHPYPDTIFVLRGMVKITYGKKSETLLALEQITIPANTPLKVEALENVILVETRGRV